MSDLDLDDLRNELADFAQPEKKVQRSAKEERVIAGFEEIQRFVDQNGRMARIGIFSSGSTRSAWIVCAAYPSITNS